MRYKTLFLVGLMVGLPFSVFGASYTITSTASSNQRDSYGYDNTYYALATPFTTSGAGDIRNILFAVRKSGSPSGNTVLSLQADNAGSPSGSTLSSLTVANSSITTSCADYIGVLSATTTLSASTQYWLVYTVSNAPDSSNYLFNCGATSGGSDLYGTVAYSWTSDPSSLSRISLLVYQAGSSSASTSPYASYLMSTSTTATYGDIALISGVALFLLAFIPAGYFASLFKRKLS